MRAMWSGRSFRFTRSQTFDVVMSELSPLATITIRMSQRLHQDQKLGKFTGDHVARHGIIHHVEAKSVLEGM